MRILLLFLLLIIPAMGPKAPPQPEKGPGSSEYKFHDVKKNVYGTGATQYWIFQPSSPAPSSAPMIAFMHGWGAMNPRAYGAWIGHLVKRGAIVIYPRYQTEWRYLPSLITSNSVEAIKAALDQLKQNGDIQVEPDHFAIVGHSAGGQVAANLGTLSASSGLPKPKAIMCVEPGNSWRKPSVTQIPLEDMSKIPSDVLLLTVVGEADMEARDIDAKRIFNETTQVPLSNKNFINVLSDTHGIPRLIADHLAPASIDDAYDSGEKIVGAPKNPLLEIASTNALDYYGYWKLFDALTDAAFYGKNREYALGNTPQQRFMGTWSDGVPVKELVVTDRP
jgi:dienelactone hydrolase